MLIERMMDRHGFTSFRELHAWSVANSGAFWREAWNDLGVVGVPGSRDRVGDGFENTRWFPDARLNVVDTLLAGSPHDEVVVALAEDSPRLSLTRAELRAEVAACAAAMRASGVSSGDRVAAWMPNVVETAVFGLAALSLGAIMSSASTDFGPVALVDRFAQIEPTVLLVTNSYGYGGKQFTLDDTIDHVVRELPSVELVVTVGDSGGHTRWSDWLAPHRGSALETVPLPFDHPGFILFSSGTTGRPKCIVHSAAGVLLKDLSEQGHQMDVEPGDRVLYATTCGWMMWNWLLMALGRGATIVLVDGSPGHPDLDRLWSIAEREKLTLLGVSAALIDSWRRAGLQPGTSHRLDSLKTLASTGSPLARSGFDWVTSAVSPQVRVASIAGGTDLCGCLVLSVPTEPVVNGEIQGPALGLDVTVFRPDGSEAAVDEDGELVCRNPFPTVPLRFWGDDGTRFHDAYFARFDGIWAHGDFARRTSTGGFEILGRLDATLNAKGVRIGTAEIYRVVMSIPGVTGALAVAQPHEGDSRIVLFVVVGDGASDSLDADIRAALRSQASPRHVPALIAIAPDVPRTQSGKLVELAVADIVAGRRERDTTSLANPECLEWYREWAQSADS